MRERLKVSSWLGSLLVALCLLLPPPVLAEQTAPSSVINLANLPNNSELTHLMGSAINPSALHHLDDALAFRDWQPNMATLLSSPRKHTRLWLTTTLHNNSSHALTRWLVVEPWRVPSLNAFFVDPDSHTLLDHIVTGIAAEDRPLSNGKAIIPVYLNAGETQQLFLEVQGDSLPFISITSWDPAVYSQSISQARMAHVALLAAIVTLLLVLILEFNVGLMITGLWLLVAFILESEKDGFISYYLLSSLADYAFNLRVSTWGFTEQLFLTTSVFLFGLHRSRAWQVWLGCTAFAAVLLAALTFVLDGNQVRQLGIIITGSFALSWPLMIAPALRMKRPQQITLLLLLALYWLTSSFLLLGYIFNFYYSSAFAAARIYIEIAVALALFLTYNWQQKHQLSQVEQALKNHETHSRALLEKTVQIRTADLNSALDSAKNASKAKVNFLGQVSHDLRSPLTAILGYAQLQASGSINDHKANQIIQDRALYMKDLVDGLVDYTQDIPREQDEPRDLYLITFIDNLVNQAHFLAQQHGNRFQLKMETELPTIVRCHHLKIQRVLLNLLDNAAKYTHEGYISLAVSAITDTTGQSALKFCITDTGLGMTPTQLENAFTPFYQSSEDNLGSGLGLSICFELIEQLGGQLHISSELNQSTQATCIIPYLIGDELLVTASLPTIQDLLPSFDAQGQSAWIVEDSPAIRELLDGELTELGFDTELASDAEAFIANLKAGAPAPAIIITDYCLPGASGLAVLRHAKAQWPTVPVVLLSATQNGNPSSFTSPEQCFNAYLSKPIDLLALRLTLARLCNLSESS